MITITIKNIPPKLHRGLKNRAALHKRSLNNEILLCLEHTVRQPVVDAEGLLRVARQFRQSLPLWVEDQDVAKFKKQGRP